MEGEKKMRANVPCLELRQRKDRAWVIQSAMRGTAPLWNPRSFQLHTRRRSYCGCIKNIKSWLKESLLTVGFSQFTLVTQSSTTLCDRMNRSMPGFLSITNSWTCSNSCPLNRWCHPTISASVVPSSSHLQSFPASGSLATSQFFASGSQRIGASASASVLPMNIQGLISFRMDWFDLLAVQGTLKSLLQHHRSKASIRCSAFPACGWGKVNFPVHERAYLPVLQSLHLDKSRQMKAEMLLPPAIISQDVYLMLSLPCL